MRSSVRFVIFLTFAVSIAGCKKEETIAVYSAPKDPPPSTAPVMPAADVSAPDGGLPDAPAASSGPLAWTVPTAWKAMPAGEMRFAAYRVNDNPPVEFTVIPLPTEAGEVLPNVNRWEHQLGLPPSPAEKLDSIVKTATVNGLTVKSVDLSGAESASPRQRMLAAMVPAGGRIWFFKLSGPIEIVTKQKDNFDALIASLKPSGGEAGQADRSATPQAAEDATAGSMKLANYHAGEGWKEIPGAKPPRMIAFTVGPSDAPAELVVTRFGSHNTGSFLDNINRWRNQLGLPPMADVKNVPMTDAQVGKAERAVLITIDNPDARPAKRMLVVISSIGPDMWFFKLTGSPATLDAQKPALDAFLKSLEFAPEGDAGEPKP